MDRNSTTDQEVKLAMDLTNMMNGMDAGEWALLECCRAHKVSLLGKAGQMADS
jgi:hypothetical protein